MLNNYWRQLMDSTAAGLFARAGSRSRELSNDQVETVSGYSIRTNPDARMIRLALDNGLMAGAISLLEVQKALDIGFRADQIILNGPGKWWPDDMLPRAPLHAIL